MNRITVAQFSFGPVAVLLLALLFLGGCSVFPGEVRHETNMRKYTSHQDGVRSTVGPYDSATSRYNSHQDGVRSTAGQYDSATSRYRSSQDGVTTTSGQYDDATAYYISRDGGGDVPQSEVMRATPRTQPQSQAPEQQVGDLPMVIEVSNILFDFDKAVIKTEFSPILDRWVDYFKNNPQVTAEIFGYTDSTGPTAYNMGLSERRAQAVINYMVGKGIQPDRLAAKGFGESQPVAPNTTKEGRQKNRRVELNF